MKKMILPLLVLLLFLSGCTTTQFEITFDTEGGNSIAAIKVEEEGLLESLETPIKEGYTFLGWYDNPELTTEFDIDNAITNSITLYAKWEETKRVVTILYGDEEVINLRLNDDEEITFPDPEVPGYIFIDWFTDDMFLNRYNSETDTNEDIIIYAKYQVIVGSVYLFHGASNIGVYSMRIGEVIELPELSLTGYEFDGWYTEMYYENKITEVSWQEGIQSIFLNLIETDVNLPLDEVDLTTLPYNEYLKEDNPVITITVKGIGVMKLQLFPDLAKNTVDNMLTYILDNDYDESTFHRVIKDFMIQGGIVSEENCEIVGEFSENGIPNDLLHYKGVLSMARTSIMDSANSQFFIVHEDSFFLDGNYAAFGGLVRGFNVLDYIANIGTNTSDTPVRDMIIESIVVDLNGYVPGAPVCAE